MQFADPKDRATAYLILRHLYDGDVIEWPVPDDHPQHVIFRELETQGLIARWDRTWPKRDRYRLTEQGIATIEAVYRPAEAHTRWDQLRGYDRPTRRRMLTDWGYDPWLWVVLHDPSTQWDRYGDDGSLWADDLWSDQRKRTRSAEHVEADGDDAATAAVVPPVVVDLDREAASRDVGDTAHAPAHLDYDVS